MVKLTKKQEKFRRYMKEMQKTGMYMDDEFPKKIPKNLQEFKKHLMKIMDGAEEEALKGLDLIFHKPTIRKLFTKSELNDYIAFAYELYNAESIKYNPLKRVLKDAKYKFDFDSLE